MHLESLHFTQVNDHYIKKKIFLETLKNKILSTESIQNFLDMYLQRNKQKECLLLNAYMKAEGFLVLSISASVPHFPKISP